MRCFSLTIILKLFNLRASVNSEVVVWRCCGSGLAGVQSVQSHNRLRRMQKELETVLFCAVFKNVVNAVKRLTLALIEVSGRKSFC